MHVDASPNDYGVVKWMCFLHVISWRTTQKKMAKQVRFSVSQPPIALQLAGVRMEVLMEAAKIMTSAFAAMQRAEMFASVCWRAKRDVISAMWYAVVTRSRANRFCLQHMTHSDRRCFK
jgi:hypothetical protein